MTGRAPWTEALPHLGRIRRAIAGSDASRVTFRGWPGSGDRLIWRALSRGTGTELDGVASGKLWRPPPVDSGDLPASADPGDENDNEPRLVLGPEVFHLDREEASAVTGLAGASLDRAQWWTGGWFAGLRWLRGDVSAAGVAAGETRIRRRILDRLSPEERIGLCAVASAPGVTLAELTGVAEPGEVEGLAAMRASWFPDLEPDAALFLPPLLALASIRSIEAARSLLARLGDRGPRSGATLRARRLGGSPGSFEGSHTEPTTTAAAQIRLELLGAASAWSRHGGEPWREVPWRLRRSLEVVAFLALAPRRRASRDALVGALWPDADPDVVAKNFHPTLSDARRSLRRALGTRVAGIEHRRGQYSLDERVRWLVDTDGFTAAIEEGRAAMDAKPRRELAALNAWRSAWQAYEGPLMAGRDAPWVEAPRAALHRRYAALLRDFGAVASAQGLVDDAIDAYRTVLIEEPFEESVHVALMTLYGSQDRRDLVRAQFRRLQDALAELGVDPRPETQRHFDQMMGMGT